MCDMKRMVITGATGAIGTALINECIRQGTEVLVLCRKDSLRNRNIPRHPLVTKEFCSLQQLAGIQNDTGSMYDVFYHLAWAGTSGNARNDLYLQNRNVTYAMDAVRAAKRFGCSVFVGTGSQAEYGRVEGVLQPDTPAFPENGYGMGKLCAGLMTRELAGQLGLQHIWVRVLSVYGPNDGENSMVMSAIRKLLAGETPEFTRGEQMWDYLYSTDAARALYLIGEKGLDKKIYVLGSGRARSLAEYISELRDIVSPGAEVKLGAVPYAAGQVMHLQADISALKKDTGFEPAVDFRDGIRETAERSGVKNTNEKNKRYDSLLQ